MPAGLPSIGLGPTDPGADSFADEALLPPWSPATAVAGRASVGSIAWVMRVITWLTNEFTTSPLISSDPSPDGLRVVAASTIWSTSLANSWLSRSKGRLASSPPTNVTLECSVLCCAALAEVVPSLDGRIPRASASLARIRLRRSATCSWVSRVRAGSSSSSEIRPSGDQSSWASACSASGLCTGSPTDPRRLPTSECGADPPTFLR
mmetsp:Transcript_18358/g.47040  ORF Transcript_18358/g.47040 Transcript_18358/m.47040 type:complete len:207 (-) Transcript_18358:285-905(-)